MGYNSQASYPIRVEPQRERILITLGCRLDLMRHSQMGVFSARSMMGTIAALGLRGLGGMPIPEFKTSSGPGHGPSYGSVFERCFPPEKPSGKPKFLPPPPLRALSRKDRRARERMLQKKLQ